MSDEMIDLADSTRTNGSSKAKPDNTDRSRLQLDTRKWLLSKLVPKKFGDKVDVNHGGNLVVAFDKDDKGVL